MVKADNALAILAKRDLYRRRNDLVKLGCYIKVYQEDDKLVNNTQ